MGFKDANGFEAKKEEAERQLKNKVRDMRTKLEKLHILPQKKDAITPEAFFSKEIPTTLFGVKQDLEWLKQEAPKTLPHENAVSDKQKKELKKLTPDKIETYQNIDSKVIKSEISILRARLSKAKRRALNEIDGIKKEIMDKEIALKSHEILKEQEKLKQEVDFLQRGKERIDKIIDKELQLNVLGLQELLNMLGQFTGEILTGKPVGGDPTWPQLSKEAAKLKASFTQMYEDRDECIKFLSRLFPENKTIIQESENTIDEMDTKNEIKLEEDSNEINHKKEVKNIENKSVSEFKQEIESNISVVKVIPEAIELKISALGLRGISAFQDLHKNVHDIQEKIKKAEGYLNKMESVDDKNILKDVEYLHGEGINPYIISAYLRDLRMHNKKLKQKLENIKEDLEAWSQYRAEEVNTKVILQKAIVYHDEKLISPEEDFDHISNFNEDEFLAEIKARLTKLKQEEESNQEITVDKLSEKRQGLAKYREDLEKGINKCQKRIDTEPSPGDLTKSEEAKKFLEKYEKYMKFCEKYIKINEKCIEEYNKIFDEYPEIKTPFISESEVLQYEIEEGEYLPESDEYQQKLDKMRDFKRYELKNSDEYKDFRGISGISKIREEIEECSNINEKYEEKDKIEHFTKKIAEKLVAIQQDSKIYSAIQADISTWLPDEIMTSSKKWQAKKTYEECLAYFKKSPKERQDFMDEYNSRSSSVTTRKSHTSSLLLRRWDSEAF